MNIDGAVQNVSKPCVYRFSKSAGRAGRLTHRRTGPEGPRGAWRGGSPTCTGVTGWGASPARRGEASTPFAREGIR
jgi:hypothetical protein